MDHAIVARALHLLGVVLWIGGVGFVTTLLVGGSGLYLVEQWNLWDRFQSLAYWWMHAMVLVWLLFTVMLFIAEPLFLHRRFLEAAKRRPDATFRMIERMHWVLLAISLATVLGAVTGSHGWEF